MRRREFIVSTLSIAACLPRPVAVLAQRGAPAIDLATLEEGKGLQVLNKRTVSRVTDGARRGIRFSEAEGEGVAYFDGVTLANGAIEVDIRGKDVQGQSFVGVAFHCVDGTTYDAI